MEMQRKLGSGAAAVVCINDDVFAKITAVTRVNRGKSTVERIVDHPQQQQSRLRARLSCLAYVISSSTAAAYENRSGLLFFSQWGKVMRRALQIFNDLRAFLFAEIHFFVLFYPPRQFRWLMAGLSVCGRSVFFPVVRDVFPRTQKMN